MGVYTRYTAAWLNRRYSKIGADGVYHAHMPIFGLNHPASEGSHPVRFGIVYRVLKELARLEWNDLLVVGGGEGFVAHAAERVLGGRAVDLDLSHESQARAFDAFGALGVAADATRLPFADGSFDVVLCSEVVEHLEFPLEAMFELLRVARRAVVLTTLEYERDHAAIAQHRFQRCGYPHFEQNLFAERDFDLVFGREARRVSTLRAPFPNALASERDLVEWLPRATDLEHLTPEGAGITLVKELVPSRRAPRLSNQELAERLVRDVPVRAEDFRARRRERAPAELVARCVCPIDRTPLVDRGAELVSSAGRRFAVKNGVPLLMDLDHADPSAAQFEHALAQRFDEPARRAELAELRTDLVGTGVPGRRRFDLTVRDQRRSWRFGPALEEVHGVGRGLCLRAHDSDPFVVLPTLALPVRDVLGFRLVMRVHAPQHAATHGNGQVFWLREGDDDFDESRSLRFVVANSPDVHEYRVELAAALASGGDTDQLLVLLRLDPADGSCGIELLEFELFTRTS